ncbi:MAG TPA: 3-oxoacyl-ACP reductase FabG [Vicinamibacterales bacterium]|nr:3-oxoacyl-ACP reductase FabG [Vicinamibacterales bacterium]
MDGLTGRTALVSGGSRGIGEAIVLDLARRGVRVVFSYRENGAAAAAVVERATALGGDVRAVAADAADARAAARLIEDAVGAVGEIDLLVNNAGINRAASLAFMSDASWDAVIQTNLSGAFYLTRLTVQRLLKHKRPGSIVNVSSLTALRGAAGQTNYAASKAGLIGMTASLAREVAPYGIRVNAVAPGYIDTEMVAAMPKDRVAALVDQIPMKRLGRGDEVARMVSFLLSDAASYITGSVIPIDGGHGA